MTQTKYQAVPGSEEARIYRDRLRSLELDHIQKKADQLAGGATTDDEIAELEQKMGALEDAAKKAEARDDG